MRPGCLLGYSVVLGWLSLSGVQAESGDTPLPGFGDRFRDCNQCPELVVVPAGWFIMGSPAGEEGREEDEGPLHRVQIEQPLAVGVYEVTREEYRWFVEQSRYESVDNCWTYEQGNWASRRDRSWIQPGYSQTDRHPVACVSFRDAKEYVQWLQRKTGHKYRLLSESEWEYVARGGTSTVFHYGQTLATEQANYDARYTYNAGILGHYRGQTTAVGSFEANRFGLYDVHGNVWEWVDDCWNNNYVDAPKDGSVWKNGRCLNRVSRGGSWFNGPRHSRSANRGWGGYVDRFNYTGLRIARTL